jgi:preprotein translocase subunit SecB
MSTQILLLDRIEFSNIRVKANSGEFALSPNFPQIAAEPEKFEFLTRSELLYPDEELDDPRHFVLTYGMKVSSDDEFNKSNAPYDIEIEASGYFHYVGADEFKEERRFRAVRFSGYQILYGAIREMVSNLTARGRHGLWHLPARNFNGVAEVRANEDEAARKKAIESRDNIPKEEIKKSRKRISKAEK